MSLKRSARGVFLGATATVLMVCVPIRTGRAAGPSAEKSALLPNLESGGGAVVLDLAGGATAAVVATDVRSLGALKKGDLAYRATGGSRALLALRGASMRLRSGNEFSSPAPDIRSGAVQVFFLKETPCQYRLATASGETYDLKVLSADEKGARIEYRASDGTDPVVEPERTTAEGTPPDSDPGNVSANAQLRKERILHFPADRSLGKVEVQDVDTDRDAGILLDRLKRPTWRSLGPARGEVTVPAGKHVHLSVFGQRAFRDLSPLSQLRPDDLYRLSVAPWQARGVDFDRDILPQIRGLTGLTILQMMYADTLPRRLSLLSEMRELEHLGIWTREAVAERPPSGASVEDSRLKQLAELASLKSLELGSNGITDAGLAHLSKLRSLRELSLYTHRLRGSGLEQLAKLPDLRCLKLFTPELRGANLHHLQGCGELRSLQLRGLRRVGDADLAFLKHLDKLEDLDLDGVSITDRALVHLEPLQSLKSLNIAKGGHDPNKIRDEGMAHLRDLASLERLALNNNDLTDAGLAHLARLPNLRSLYLATVRYVDPKMDKYYYTDIGLEALSRLKNLEELTIASPAVGDEGMAHIARLTNLKVLRIHVGRVTNDGLAKLASLKSLETLSLATPEVTVSGLNHLNALTNLKELKTKRIRQDGGGLDLSQLSNLEELSIGLRHHRVGGEVRHDTFRDEDMAWLARTNKLRWLQGISGISDAGLKHIAGLTEMERLGFSGPGITDAGLACLAGMKKLDHLHIEGDITDAGLRRLEGFKALSFLNIQSESACSRRAIERLRAELPGLAYVQIVP